LSTIQGALTYARPNDNVGHRNSSYNFQQSETAENTVHRKPNFYKKERAKMTVRFTLTMDRALVKRILFDRVIIEWEDEMDEASVTDASRKWISSQNYLTKKMLGLYSVGESSLTIEPLD
jgi:hypothetical protein